MATAETLANRVARLVQSKARFLQLLERRLGSRAEAEDVLQTAVRKLVARQGSVRDEEKLIPWCYRESESSRK
jgi:DNA-directed RNA polymerase specialized sigma24 family protein